MDTEAPGGGTIFAASFWALNDSGDALVFFNEQLFPVPQSRGFFIQSGPSRIPVAVTGPLAPDGKTFDFVGAGDMNQAGEVVFAARLSDSSRAIFHWANGVLTSLLGEDDPTPDLFTLDINDNGDLVFSGSGRIFFLGTKSGLSEVVRAGDAAPGGRLFSHVSDPKINNKGQITFRALLSDGRNGIFLASAGQ